MEKWVKAAKTAEEPAWNMLYQHYYPGLYATAVHLCKDFSVAKDLVQDSFVTAYLKLAQLKDEAAFGAWLKKILIRNWYQWKKQNSQRKNIESMSAAEVTTSEEKPEHKLDSVLNEDQLHAALKKLPETFRAPLLLRYFSGFPAYNQIAAILSLPIGTVRSRLNEAKLKLAKKWEQPVDSALDAAKERDEWNSFYFDTFSGIHDHDGCKNKFMEHLHKNVELVYPNGKSNTGSWVFEKMIMDDREAGSWLKPSNVVSSGNISIIETNHFNSPEHPHHCPAHSVLVLQRNNREVSKMNLYLSWQ